MAIYFVFSFEVNIFAPFLIYCFGGVLFCSSKNTGGKGCNHLTGFHTKIDLKFSTFLSDCVSCKYFWLALSILNLQRKIKNVMSFYFLII